ncbi:MULTISPECIES: hypothetical protein [unclassified Clostridium]|uniref:hypothetical protein n=1 Tax=unclassified Clostridium TaxID=2614128 RepID=UPI000297667E|nr:MULTISPECIES: hypothetical protein [unclassified Clostridium]EKQ57591.1 MAG: hypothetical protein A370_00721 [Clostridium sp. Maddingley MBC34-26]
MKVSIEKVFTKLEKLELFALVFIGQIIVFFVINQPNLRRMNLMQFLNNYNFCNFVIMTIIFIITISKIVDLKQEKGKSIFGFKFSNYKESIYLYKFLYVLKLTFFSSCVTFLELLILVREIGFVNYSNILLLKQSFYPLVGYLPFLVLQFSISMLINKKTVSFASGITGYFLGVLGSVGISFKFGIFNLWAYPFYTSPVITDSIYGFSVENSRSAALIFLSIILAAIMIFISLHFCKKVEITVS